MSAGRFGKLLTEQHGLINDFFDKFGAYAAEEFIKLVFEARGQVVFT